MSIDLLQKRVKVIAYYPHSPYGIGEILVFIDHVGNGSTFDLYDSIGQEDVCIYAAEVDKSPANFQPLPWWSDRDIKDMPEYVIITCSGCTGCAERLHVTIGEIIKVNYWTTDFMTARLVGKPIQIYSDWLTPATREEYEAYLKTKKL